MSISESGRLHEARGVIRVTGMYPNLVVKDHGGYQSRHVATLAMLREVFTKHAVEFRNRTFDFFIGSFDNPESCNDLAAVVPHVLAYSTTPQCLPNIHAIPDFVYGGWPEAGIESYDATTAAIAAAGQQAPQHDKLFWIGNAEMHDTRMKLVGLAQQHPDLMQCIAMNWHAAPTPGQSRLPASRFVALPDHAAYSMLLDIRGAGYSGRLKLLLHANRSVLMVQRRFKEFFYPHLKPREHYMPVKEDLSDLVERIRELKSNPDLGKRLAENASQFAKEYLTRECALNYLRDILLKISIAE